MSPEDVPGPLLPGFESRITQLERTVATHGTDIARIQSDVSNNTQMIRALAPLISQLATVAEAQRSLERAVDDLRKEWRDDVKHFDGEIEKLGDHLDEEIGKISAGQDRDKRDTKNFRYALYVAIVAAVLSPFGTLLVAWAQSQ